MTTSRLALPALIALLILGSPAPSSAKGSKPVIRQVLNGSGKRVPVHVQGGVIQIHGNTLYQLKEGEPLAKAPIKVTIAGKTTMLLKTSFDQVSVLIPQSVPAGKHTLSLSIKGRGSATAKVEVVTRETYDKKYRGDLENRTEGGNRLNSIDLSIKAGFRITKFLRIQNAAGNSFMVEGTAGTIPRGLNVDLTLRYEQDRVIMARSVRVQKGKIKGQPETASFSTTFGPYKQKLLMGNYSVEMSFKLKNQSRRRIAKWVRGLNQRQKDAYAHIVTPKFLAVGSGPQGTVTKEDRQSLLVGEQSHYRNLTKSAAKLLDDIMYAHACAGRSYFKKPGTYDKDKWKAWIDKQGLPAKLTKKVESDFSYSTRSGHFKAEDYRKWSEETLFREMGKLMKEHRDYNGQYVCSPNTRAERLGSIVVSLTWQLYNKWTVPLHRSVKNLEIPPKLITPPFELSEAPQVTVKFLRAKLRELKLLVKI